MKRVFSIVLCVTLLFSLASCFLQASDPVTVDVVFNITTGEEDDEYVYEEILRCDDISVSGSDDEKTVVLDAVKAALNEAAADYRISEDGSVSYLAEAFGYEEKNIDEEKGTFLYWKCEVNGVAGHDISKTEISDGDEIVYTWTCACRHKCDHEWK